MFYISTEKNVLNYLFSAGYNRKIVYLCPQIKIMMSDSENITIKELKNGNKKTFEVIFKTYYRALCLYSESIVGEKEAAEEVVNDFFLKLWEKRDIIQINVSIKAYLYKGVYNNSLKHLEHIKVLRKYREHAQYMIANRDLFQPRDALSMLISKEITNEIEKAIDALPEQCREVFLQTRLEGLKYQEVANNLGISVNTVRTQITRAMTKLRKSLGKK